MLVLTETKCGPIQEEDPHAFQPRAYQQQGYTTIFNGPSRSQRLKKAREQRETELKKTDEYKRLSDAEKNRALKRIHIDGHTVRGYGGVAIMIRNEWMPYFHYKLSEDTYSIEWSLLTDAKHKLHGIAIYGNNTSDAKLKAQWKRVYERVVERADNPPYNLENGDSLVIIGDFNAVAEERDRCIRDADETEQPSSHSTRINEHFANLIDAAPLTDAWRRTHPGVRDYSRVSERAENEQLCSRIDGALVSPFLATKIKECEIVKPHDTWASKDHYRVTLTLEDIPMRVGMPRSYTPPASNNNAARPVEYKICGGKLRKDNATREKYTAATKAKLYSEQCDQPRAVDAQSYADNQWQTLTKVMLDAAKEADVLKERTNQAPQEDSIKQRTREFDLLTIHIELRRILRAAHAFTAWKKKRTDPAHARDTPPERICKLHNYNRSEYRPSKSLPAERSQWSEDDYKEYQAQLNKLRRTAAETLEKQRKHTKEAALRENIQRTINAQHVNPKQFWR
jgi:exonuclease III